MICRSIHVAQPAYRVAVVHINSLVCVLCAQDLGKARLALWYGLQYYAQFRQQPGQAQQLAGLEASLLHAAAGLVTDALVVSFSLGGGELMSLLHVLGADRYGWSSCLRLQQGRSVRRAVWWQQDLFGYNIPGAWAAVPTEPP